MSAGFGTTISFDGVPFKLSRWMFKKLFEVFDWSTHVHIQSTKHMYFRLCTWPSTDISWPLGSRSSFRWWSERREWTRCPCTCWCRNSAFHEKTRLETSSVISLYQGRNAGMVREKNTGCNTDVSNGIEIRMNLFSPFLTVVLSNSVRGRARKLDQDWRRVRSSQKCWNCVARGKYYRALIKTKLLQLQILNYTIIQINYFFQII